METQALPRRVLITGKADNGGAIAGQITTAFKTFDGSKFMNTVEIEGIAHDPFRRRMNKPCYEVTAPLVRIPD